MSKLAPRNYVPVSFATVFLIASILHEQTNRSPDEPRDEYFNGYCLPTAGYRKSGPRKIGEKQAVSYDLVSIAVELVPNCAKSGNPYGYDAIRIVFRSAYGDPFSEQPENTSWSGPAPHYHLSLTLRPPFNTCLSPETVNRCLNSGLIRAVSPLPDGFGISFPSFEEDAKTRYRQSLADGFLGGVVHEESGCLTPIPVDFWRSSAANAVFYEDAPISFDMDGRQVTGDVLVDLATLRDGWRSALNGVPAVIRMTERSFSPYIDFLLEVCRNLNMVDGCDVNGNKILAKDLQLLIEEMWKSRPNLGKRSANKINMMVTMLRHTDLEKGGLASEEGFEASRKAVGQG